MKCFILLALFVGLAVAGDEDAFFNEIETKWKSWSEIKAYETCFGSEFMEEFTIRSKKATRKCYGKQMPELKVWEMLKPERLVMAMMRGLKNKHKNKVENMIKSMTQPQQQQQSMPFMPFQQFQQQKSDGASNGEMQMMMKMMKLMMMKEMMSKMTSPMDMMAGAAGGMEGGVVSARGFNSNNDDFEMANFFRQLLKAAAQRKATSSSSVVRSRRAAEAVDYKDLYDLGDKLTEKLEAMKESYMTQMGNMTCWFQEMKVLNEDGDLDMDAQLEDIETWPWASQWLKEKNIEMVKKCTTNALQTPVELFTNNEVDERWLRIKTWWKCAEEVKQWSCMGLDVKRMLEKQFGDTQGLMDETGLDEESLLYLTQAIIDESM